jgi:hypothetical protein
MENLIFFVIIDLLLKTNNQGHLGMSAKNFKRSIDLSSGGDLKWNSIIFFVI